MLKSGGVAQDLFEELNGEFDQRNRKSMFILSILGIGEGIMLIASDLASGLFEPALPMYTILLITSIVFAILARSGRPHNPRLLLFFCYAGLFVAMTYGMGIAFQTPAPNDRVASTFMVLFVALPLMFIDAAWRMILFEIMWSVIFASTSFVLSSPAVFQANMLNVVAFTILAIVLYCTISCDHVRQVVDHVRLEDEIEHVNEVQSAILLRLSNVIEGRDVDTGGHVMRTCAFVGDLLYDLRDQEEWRMNLPEGYVRHVIASASLHDMGKLQIPDAILNKPGKLTEEEFDTMKMHTVYGEVLIHRTLEGVLSPDEMQIAGNIALLHHERWDGQGYPHGLAGEQIPIEARAMALADVFDALTHERCYKKAMSVEEAIRIIEEGRGTHFDPQMTDVFIARRRVEGCDVSNSRVQVEQLMQFGVANVA